MNAIFSNILIREAFLRNAGNGRERSFLPSDTFLTECFPELDHAGDIDYVSKVGNKAFGIQIKPVTAKANFGNYSATERMKADFADFTAKFGGKVFYIFSEKVNGSKQIANKEVIEDIRHEIERLK